MSLHRDRSTMAQKKETKIIEPSFYFGDFVLVHLPRDRCQNLQFRWYGACRSTSVYELIMYGVSTSHDNKPKRVHCTRKVKYRDSLLGKEVTKGNLYIA